MRPLRIFTLPPFRGTQCILPSLIATIILCWTGPAAAQTAGTLKAAFNPTGAPYTSSEVAALQPDGKIIYGTISAILRLNTDGSIDASFNAPSGLGRVISLTVVPAGKIVAVVAGTSSSRQYNNYRLLRLQTDGTLDPSFSPATIQGLGLSSELYECVVGVQPDGRVLVAGDFTGPATSGTYVHMLRFNADGSPDTTFQTPIASINVVYNAIVPQASGKVLVAGSETTFSPSYGQHARLLLLNADGTIDTTFQADVGQATGAYAPTLLPNGRIVYLADFPQPSGQSSLTLLGGVPRRLNANGTADASFAPQFDPGASFSALIVQANGKIVVGGYTTNYNAPPVGNVSQIITKAGVARLNPDGTADQSFDAGTGASDTSAVQYVFVAPDSSIVVVGSFDSFDGQARMQIAELYGDVGLNVPFFAGEATLANNVYYLALPNGNIFGYYEFYDQADPHFLYHFDLGFEYVLDAADGHGGVYLYDFKSGGFFYTSPTFAFPYLYDFGLQAFLYYYPDPTNPQRYNTNGVRYFYNFSTRTVISK